MLKSKGFFSTDDVELLGLRAESMKFLKATSFSATDMIYDGIIGLSFGERAEPTDHHLAKPVLCFLHTLNYLNCFKLNLNKLA